MAVGPTRTYSVSVRQVEGGQYVAEVETAAGHILATAIGRNEAEVVSTAVRQAFPDGERE